jgi:hypothetical protein
MDQLWSLLDYLRENPKVAAVVVAGIVGFYLLLNRKPKMVKEAEEHLKVLRREKKEEGHYNKLRFPR